MKIPNPFNRKSRLQRLVEPVAEALDIQKATSILSDMDLPKKGRSSLAIAGGAAAIAAGSAVLSSLRRRSDGDGDS